MSTKFTINGRQVDITDAAAVQALSDPEYAELLRQSLKSPAAPDDRIVGLVDEQPTDGTGFLIMTPPTEDSSTP